MSAAPALPQPPAAGLLLLTGGRGRRFGAPKHLQAHPAGGSWGGHLVAVFEALFPGCPVHLLGHGLPDRPDLAVLEDPGQGPAVALRHWANGANGANGADGADGAKGAPAPERWWLVGCDQIGWSSAALGAWHRVVAEADPGAGHWVLARCQGRIQPLGGFLGAALVPALARTPGRSLMALAEALPTRVLEEEGPAWADVDTPEAFADYLRRR